MAMKFKGTPNLTVVVQRKPQFSTILKPYKAVRFDKNGIAEVDDNFVIEKLKANGYEVVEEKPKTAKTTKKTSKKGK